jgi:hypothetical protein
MREQIERKWRKRKRIGEKESFEEFIMLSSGKSEEKLPFVSNFSDFKFRV